MLGERIEELCEIVFSLVIIVRRTNYDDKDEEEAPPPGEGAGGEPMKEDPGVANLLIVLGVAFLFEKASNIALTPISRTPPKWPNKIYLSPPCFELVTLTSHSIQKVF